jgi:hypothetical protein
MAWRKKTRKAPLPKAPPPPPVDQGPRRTTLPDGTIIEESAATGRSVILPAGPARRGLDVRPSAPGWGAAWRRWFGYSP